ncbi:MAG TPA: branched-chain amino acid ABC transporter permease [Abditibacteriaceae bacterium]|jgi:branched-chain amino acid transport system permease protein
MKTWLLRAMAAALIIGILFVVQSVVAPRLTGSASLLIMQAGVAVVLATSLNLISGITGQFSLGHAGFAAVGAYASAMFSIHAAPRLALVDPLIFALAILVGAAASAFAGYLVGLPSLRLRGDYLAIVTLGFGQIIYVSLRNMDIVGGATGLDNIPQWTNFIWVGGAVALCLACVWSLNEGAWGRSMRAVREDEVAAEAAGIDTTRVKVTAFVVGAAWAGVAGALQAHFSPVIQPSSAQFVESVKIVVMVVLGGLGSISGVAFAAIALRVLEEKLRDPTWAITTGYALAALTAWLSWRAIPLHAALGTRVRSLGFAFALFISVLALHLFGREWVNANAPSLRYLIYALVLIVLMLLRPQGLLGRGEIGWPRWGGKNRPASGQSVEQLGS